MSTLSFLKKKGFNPANFKNQEAVWLAEQAAEAERKKVAELQKQLDEERQVEELQRLAEGKGEGKSKKSRRGMSWMYEMPLSASDGPIDATGEAADAFLSGKEVNDAVKGDLGAFVLDGSVGAKLAPTSQAVSARDALAKIKGDPLAAIRARGEAAREAALAERALRERLEGKKEEDGGEARRRRHGGHRHRKRRRGEKEDERDASSGSERGGERRRHRRHRRRQRSASSGSGSDEDRRRRRRRRRRDDGDADADKGPAVEEKPVVVAETKPAASRTAAGAAAALLQKQRPAAAPRRAPLSDAEKAQRLAAMQQHAASHEASQRQAIRTDAAEERAEEAATHSGTGAGAFLSKVHQEAFGTSTQDTLEDRIRRDRGRQRRDED